MGCGSGRAIADIISGVHPEVNFAFTGMMPRKPHTHAVAVTGQDQQAA